MGKIAIYPPHRNLGCLGFGIGSLYFDFHRVYWGRLKVQMFISWAGLYRLGLSKTGKGWLNEKGWSAMH